MLALNAAPERAFAQKKSDKKAPAAAPAAAAAPAGVSAAAAVSDKPAFEGVVSFKKGATGSKNVSSVVMFIKGDRFMADEKGDKIQQKIIVDATKKVVFMVLDKDRMIMEMPMEGKALSKKPEPALPKKTGKTQKIAGIDCEQWLDKNFQGEVELWTSNDMGRLFIPEGPMGDGLIPSASIQKLLKQGTYFPMLLVERDKTGKEITRLEVTNVEKKMVDEATFTPPAGYQKIDMPGAEK
jgi:hypothetical protein